MSSSYFFDSQLAVSNPVEYVKDKEKSCKTFMNYMKIRLLQMFHYENLPDTIPYELFENYLLSNGTCFITKVDTEVGKNNLYALIGSYGGEPDPYYRPTRFITANPGLKLSHDYDINNDGVLIRNDPLWVGLYPLMSRYGVMLAENMLTIRMADIMLRVVALMTAPDDKGKIAAEEYLKKLERGDLGVIGESRFMDDGIKLQSPPSSNGSYLTQFIELNQYLIGTFYNEVGLNANFNMKRESIGEGESSLNEDSLLPLCEAMLKTRKEDFEKVNKMFGTNIKVEFDSAWLNNQKELEFGLKKLEMEASQLANERPNDDLSGCSTDDKIESESDKGNNSDATGDTGNADTNVEQGESERLGETEGSGNAEDGKSNESDSGLEDNDLMDAVVEVAAEIVAKIIKEDEDDSKDD